jgi:hypothetical protein
MKIVVVTVAMTLLACAAVSAGSIAGYRLATGDSDPTPESDRVVGVLAKCQLLAAGKTFDLTGSDCQRGDQQIGQSGAVIINSRLELTVRTSEGSTYEIDVPFGTDVEVGDAWPKSGVIVGTER